MKREPNLKERMGDVMGGKVLPLPSDKLREAREIGISQGMEAGMKTKTQSVVSNMLKRGMADADICALAECDIAFVERVRRHLAEEN